MTVIVCSWSFYVWQLNNRWEVELSRFVIFSSWWHFKTHMTLRWIVACFTRKSLTTGLINTTCDGFFWNQSKVRPRTTEKDVISRAFCYFRMYCMMRTTGQSVLSGFNRVANVLSETPLNPALSCPGNELSSRGFLKARPGRYPDWRLGGTWTTHHHTKVDVKNWNVSHPTILLVLKGLTFFYFLS